MLRTVCCSPKDPQREGPGGVWAVQDIYPGGQVPEMSPVAAAMVGQQGGRGQESLGAVLWSPCLGGQIAVRLQYTPPWKKIALISLKQHLYWSKIEGLSLKCSVPQQSLWGAECLCSGFFLWSSPCPVPEVPALSCPCPLPTWKKDVFGASWELAHTAWLLGHFPKTLDTDNVYLCFPQLKQHLVCLPAYLPLSIKFVRSWKSSWELCPSGQEEFLSYMGSKEKKGNATRQHAGSIITLSS